MKRSIRTILQIVILCALVVMMTLPVHAATQRIICTKPSLYCGESTQLKTSGMSGRITWTSSNPGLVTVSGTGVARAVRNAAGVAEIKASNGKLWASYRITVKTIHLNYTRKMLSVGDKLDLILSKGYGVVNWHTSNKDVATWTSLSKDGSTAYMVAKKAGTTVVKATYNGVTCVCGITVVGAPKPTVTPKPPRRPTVTPTPKPAQTGTIRTSSSLKVIETAGFVDVTVTGASELRCTGGNGIVTCKWGKWGSGSNRNRIRLYVTGKRNGRTLLTITNLKNGRSATTTFVVQGMSKSPETLRRVLSDRLVKRSGRRITDQTVMKGYGCTYQVSYNPSSTRFNFRADLKNNQGRGTLILNMNASFTKGRLTYDCVLISGKKYTVTAVIEPDMYDPGAKLNYEVSAKSPGLKDAAIGRQSDAAADLAMELWNLLLVENAQMDMNGIGFEKCKRIS